MHLANDMLNLRRQIDDLRAARSGMISGMRQFSRELRKSVAIQMAEMHRRFAEECARAHSARSAFNRHNQHMVHQMIGAFRTERHAARRNFLGKSA